MAHSTSRDGVRIYYEEHGSGDPVLLAYGIGGNAGMWEPNIEALSAGHRLILWEPRGHARSDSPENPQKVTFAHWVWDLHDLMDHLQLEPDGRDVLQVEISLAGPGDARGPELGPAIGTEPGVAGVLDGATADFKLGRTRHPREGQTELSEVSSAIDIERALQLRRLGNNLRIAGRLREAGEAFRRALNVIPRDGWLIYDFARLLRSQASAMGDARLLLRARAALRREQLLLDGVVHRARHHLAVDDAPVRQRGLQRRRELREVAVHRLLVAALQQDLLPVAKNQRSKPVPLGLELPSLAVRQGLRAAGQHGREGRSERQSHLYLAATLLRGSG